jgi:hypothetical protein
VIGERLHFKIPLAKDLEEFKKRLKTGAAAKELR